jgi:hypothetical protein
MNVSPFSNDDHWNICQDSVGALVSGDGATCIPLASEEMLQSRLPRESWILDRQWKRTACQNAEVVVAKRELAVSKSQHVRARVVSARWHLGEQKAQALAVVNSALEC